MQKGEWYPFDLDLLILQSIAQDVVHVLVEALQSTVT